MRNNKGQYIKGLKPESGGFKKGHVVSEETRDKIRKLKTTHGLSNSKEHKKWDNMKGRILNPKGDDVRLYKNIKICNRWINSFENFYKDMGEIPKDGKRYSLGRIDNKGNYCPENCRWETDMQQANNRRTTHWITYMGKTMSMMQWSKYLNKPYGNIKNRLNNLGWTVERTFNN